MPIKLIKFSGEEESFLADTYKKTGMRKGTERLLLNHDAGILGPGRRRIQSGARDKA